MTPLMPPLVPAHVKKRERGGILIYGQEEQQTYQAPSVPQVWWCKPAITPEEGHRP